MSIRDRALATPTRRGRTVTVSEWDGDVHIVELNGEQRIAFLESCMSAGEGRVQLSVLMPYLTDLIRRVENPTLPVFDPADGDQLLRDHPAVVQRVLLLAVELSEFDAVSVDSAVGNSDDTPS